MREVNIGRASDFSDPGRRIIESDGVEVGVFRLGDAFFAYANICPHMGGPACQGKVIAKVDEIIAADRTSSGMAFSKSQTHVVCPWHGFEFDIRTGRHPGSDKLRLRPFKVRVSADGDVLVEIPERRSRAVTSELVTDDISFAADGLADESDARA
jgi:nitrite reductase/ring-hydroxylating ferredoxin subunit